MANIDKEGYLNKVSAKYGDKVEILSEFMGRSKPIEICYHCEKHGDTIKTMIAKNVFDRAFNPCAECKREKKSVATAKAHKMSKDDFYRRLVEYCRDNNGTVLENEWVSAKTVYHFKCDNPEHPIFESTADSLYSGNHWCPYCCGRKGSFAEEIEELVKQKGGVIVTPYVNNTIPMRIKCLKHNHEWNISPCNLLKGKWCNVCSMSVYEKTAFDWFVNNNFNIDVQYKFDDLIGVNGNPYRFDFAVLDKNDNLRVLVEIDDESHRCLNKYRIGEHRRDKEKDEYCKNNNIELYRVPIERWKISSKGRDWYYNYLDEKLGFLKEAVV